MKKFTESLDDKPLQPKVKHIIEYLSKLDPEMDVYLDHDGWDIGYIADVVTEVDIVEQRGLFDVISHQGKQYMIINN